ncbi:MAG: hypothetical protein Q9223_007520, partial [Gallowayella weberi]
MQLEDRSPNHYDGLSSSNLEAQPSNSEKEKDTKLSAFKGLGLLDRYLAVWILLAMAVGMILGNFVPNTGPALQKGKFIGVSVPIAIGLLVMMYPILCKIKFESLHHVFKTRDVWIQIAFSVFLNWIIAPLLALAWAFLPDKPELREGLILVGLARCIAMVLIWTSLAAGDTEYCAILVAINSLLQIALFAPLAILFLRVIPSTTTSTIPLSYPLVAKSVAVFLGIPLAAAILTRLTLRTLISPSWYTTTFLPFLSPFSLLGLLFTILILFASQATHVSHQIISVVRVAAPLCVYFLLIFSCTLLVAQSWLGFGYKLAATQSFTAASNNFELAIAVAVATFGVESPQALAATVGPLVEVPVM